MEANKKIVQIIRALKEAETLLDEMGNSPVSPVDHDLVLTRIRSLYERLLLLEVGGDHPQGKQEKEDSRASFVTRQTVTPQKSREEEKTTPGETGLEAAGYKEEVIKPVPDTLGTATRQKAPRPEVAQKTKGKAPEILADKFSGDKAFVHDAISRGRKANDLSSQLQKKPIKSIGQAIGLNDKFTFIRELFNGDAAMYEATIRKLNASESFEEALSHLREFKWNMDEPPASNLLELTRRKFIPQEPR
jgi:hypothetical protein